MSQALPPDSVLALEEEARKAFLRHVRKPHIVGNDGEHLRLWTAAYEARAALAERNPVFAATLVARNATAPVPGPGLPLRPAGVRWSVDESAPNTVTVTLDVAGPVTVTVRAPKAIFAASAPITQGAARATTTFNAPADGLYTLTLSVGGSLLATVYVPVMRGLFRQLREMSRALAYQFRQNQRPRPGDDFRTLLALMMAAEAAAHTRQGALYYALVAAAEKLAPAPHPVALYPHV